MCLSIFKISDERYTSFCFFVVLKPETNCTPLHTNKLTVFSQIFIQNSINKQKKRKEKGEKKNAITIYKSN